MTQIDRGKLRALLERWQRGEIDERIVHDEAEAMLEQADWPVYQEADPRSIVVEVLSHLEILDHQLITREDIPTMIAFLDVATGQEPLGWDAWRRYWNAIDFDVRRQALRNNAFYST
jgi:hypothetical protein